MDHPFFTLTIKSKASAKNKMKDTTAVEVAKPWLFTGGSFLLANFSQILGLIAMILSISYTIWKWHRDIKFAKNAK